MRVVFTPAAEADLDDIWLNVALESPRAADKLIDDIRDRTSPLFDFPELGSARPEIAAEMRVLTEGAYLILYRIVEDGVEIVRVIHGARDLTALF
ncbi:MAG: type II toxin-antitoxin system RelE/ParE family toxin [Rhizobiales bacterium]|nr:type II toxin-antitoxin system RelE/ParE family toxin [Hyphomicrobiales bacterium]